ncbi:hypothetical protein M8C21_024399, partial [Ambrosia artemisiifolia]
TMYKNTAYTEGFGAGIRRPAKRLYVIKMMMMQQQLKCLIGEICSDNRKVYVVKGLWIEAMTMMTFNMVSSVILCYYLLLLICRMGNQIKDNFLNASAQDLVTYLNSMFPDCIVL